MTNYSFFKFKFAPDHENDIFNQKYQKKDFKRHHRPTKEKYT